MAKRVLLIILLALDLTLILIEYPFAAENKNDAEDVLDNLRTKERTNSTFHNPNQALKPIQAHRTTGPESLIVGSGAGMVEAFCTFPLWVWKTRAQYLGKHETELEKVFTLNPKIIFKGVDQRMATMAVIVAARVWGRDSYLNIVYQTNVPTFTQNFVSSFFGGGIGAIVNSISEFLLIQRQKNSEDHKFLSTWSTYNEIKRQRRRSLFLRGLPCTVARDGIITSFMLCFTPHIKEYLLLCEVNPLIAILGSGLSSGFSGAILSHPFDTIKAIQQAHPLSKHSKTSIEIYHAIIRSRGWRGFYDGFYWRTGRLVLTVPITFYATEEFTVALKFLKAKVLE